MKSPPSPKLSSRERLRGTGVKIRLLPDLEKLPSLDRNAIDLRRMLSAYSVSPANPGSESRAGGLSHQQCPRTSVIVIP